MSIPMGVKSRKKHGGNRDDIKRALRMKKRNGKTFSNNTLTPQQYHVIKRVHAK
jgi:hypothetical protein